MIATDYQYGPLMENTDIFWQEPYPYNDSLPIGDTTCTWCHVNWDPDDEVVVGCVATAAGMIMKYWGYPDSGQGDTSYYWGGDYTCSDSGAGACSLSID